MNNRTIFERKLERLRKGMVKLLVPSSCIFRIDYIVNIDHVVTSLLRMMEKQGLCCVLRRLAMRNNRVGEKRTRE